LLGQLLLVLTGVATVIAALGSALGAGVATVLAPLGFVFILLSGYMSSLRGAIGFIAINLLLIAMIAIDRRFGRRAAGITWVAIVVPGMLLAAYIKSS
jgi:hypothetical protein